MMMTVTITRTRTEISGIPSMGMMTMNRELAASCLTTVKWSQRVGPSGTTYGGRRLVPGREDAVSSVPPVSEPSRRLTSSCRRSCAMSRISWLRRASAFTCTLHPQLQSTDDAVTQLRGRAPATWTCVTQLHGGRADLFQDRRHS